MKKNKIFVTLMIFLLLLTSHSNRASAMGISSQCGILMEQSTGRVLYEKCPNDQMYIASITKILTTIVAIENADLDAWVEVSENVTQQVGSALYLTLGDQVKLIDLLYGLMLRSGNDAAMAIAEFVGEDEEGFVKMMNEKAQEIGMTNSVFQNPSGLDETTYNLSTAKDMALVMQYAMNNPIFREITGTKTHKATTKNGTTYVWNNKHKLVTGYYDYAIGGKTGFTKQARRTLVTSARKDEMELIVVTLKAGDDWNDHMSLFNYGFDHYEVKTLMTPGEIHVENRELKDKLYIEKQVDVVVAKDGSEKVTTDLSLYEKAKGKEVGQLKLLMSSWYRKFLFIKQSNQKLKSNHGLKKWLIGSQGR